MAWLTSNSACARSAGCRPRLHLRSDPSKPNAGWRSALPRIQPGLCADLLENEPKGAHISMAIGYNEFITFGRNGTARALKCSGIDFDEDGDRSWTSAPVVELDVPLSIPRQEVFLEIS